MKIFSSLGIMICAMTMVKVNGWSEEIETGNISPIRIRYNASILIESASYNLCFIHITASITK